jgi:D-alanyl-lipoteichoic acid acyltransferase DltB (MBOAT superfamily)
LNIILPVGISFYTFQTLSYTIDIYRKKLKPTNNFIDFALFVAFFPQLVAGPIERAANLLPQLSQKLRPTKTQLKYGVNLIVIGLFKKVLIGDTAGRYVDHIYGTEGVFGGSDYLFALLLFSIQIYADFSGYSSIARGVAKLLGVELMKNFEQPYLSRNITEFWRRWHISLSSWLRDYLYIPLGGNKKGIRRTYINLMLTMLIGGLWHGASWNFVIWGGLHGIYLAIHKLYLGNKKPDTNNISFKEMSVLEIITSVGNILLTYILVLITWLFFRSTDFDFTVHVLNEIIIFKWFDHSSILLQIVIVYTAVIALIDIWQYSSGKHSIITTIKDPIAQVVVNVILFGIVLMYMLQLEPLPFIYFQF